MNLMQWVVKNPVFSIGLTFFAYWLALALHRRWRWIPPIVTACLPIVAVLLLLREPYEEYNRGGSYLSWWLGPATVALAVPMYRHGMALRRSLPRLALIVVAGSVVGMATAGLTAWLLGAPLPVVMSTVPKSVTTPIAIEVCKELQGIPQITIALVILTGVLGASFGAPLLRFVGVRDDRAIGAAVGTSAHGIGTASLVRHSEMQATVSSWAMAAAGVSTSLLAALLALFLRWGGWIK
jgi:predicted murein hydrolase (TIGR00659 family)